MSKEKFPKNRHIGNSRTAIWLESEIEEYIKNVIDMVDYNVNPHKAAKQTQSTAANQKAATNEEAQEKPRAAANAAGSTRTITGEPFERLTIEILRNKTTGETWLKLGNLNTDRLLQSIATMISLE